MADYIQWLFKYIILYSLIFFKTKCFLFTSDWWCRSKQLLKSLLEILTDFSITEGELSKLMSEMHRVTYMLGLNTSIISMYLKI